MNKYLKYFGWGLLETLLVSIITIPLLILLIFASIPYSWGPGGGVVALIVLIYLPPLFFLIYLLISFLRRFLNGYSGNKKRFFIIFSLTIVLILLLLTLFYNSIFIYSPLMFIPAFLINWLIIITRRKFPIKSNLIFTIIIFLIFLIYLILGLWLFIGFNAFQDFSKKHPEVGGGKIIRLK